MINSLRLVAVSLFAAVILFFGNANAAVASPTNLGIDGDVTIVAAWAHSNGGPKELANIGEKGYVFSGTLTARSATYAWDTVVEVYTDKSRKLWVDVEVSDADAKAERLDDVSYKLVTSGGTMLGTITFDAETGDLTIDGEGAGWFQGTLMGMYSQHH